jgi:hypothetical protein
VFHPNSICYVPLSTDMCSCRESEIVCGLFPYYATTKCRRTASVSCWLELKTAHKSAGLHVSAYCPHTFLFPSKSHTMFYIHTYLECLVNQAMSWREGAGGMCAGYTFFKRRKNGQNMRNVYGRGACLTMEFRKETVFFGS